MSFLDTIYKQDLSFVYSDIGTPVSYKGFTTHGVLVNEPTEVLTLNSKHIAVQDTTLVLTIVTGSIGIITNNDNLVVGTTIFKINRFIPITNGLETKLWLSRL